ncbi:GIY-YIG nuclease family protein [Dyella sp. 2HG41-7]|uniref:GIY-YIG nuclease family protein n=1 Tax=Dyella sp. 2HG41-7 TaxID=2883239 RepID=UPI001F3DFB5F|nr:GIY-YIG nuclease family protein [Dyella sp. 2HG41-7]
MDGKQPCVYVLASRRNGTLYIGVTSNLIKRIWQHKNDFVEGFTNRHDVHTLVWYELHATMESAITREKQLKEWKRFWKIRLIEAVNPDWIDFYPTLLCQ